MMGDIVKRNNCKCVYLHILQKNLPSRAGFSLQLVPIIRSAVAAAATAATLIPRAILEGPSAGGAFFTRSRWIYLEGTAVNLFSVKHTNSFRGLSLTAHRNERKTLRGMRIPISDHIDCLYIACFGK
jgi:hypothetical protein